MGRRDAWRMPVTDAGAPGAAARTQLEIFRELRQARSHTADQASQLARAQQDAAQQQARHEEQIQALKEAREAAERQAARLEEKLVANQVIIDAQAEAIEQTLSQLSLERQRGAELAERIADLEHGACIAASAHWEAVWQLQGSLNLVEQRCAALDALRTIAEATVQSQRQAVLEAAEQRDAETKRVAVLMEEIANLRSSANVERAEWGRKLLETQQQATTAEERASSLRTRLNRYVATMRAERAQLDDTALALCEARVAACQLVDAEKLSKIEAELSVVQQQLTSRTTERDQARLGGAAVAQALLTLNQKHAAVEADLAAKNAFIAEMTPKLNKRYAQLLLIKQKQDWRL